MERSDCISAKKLVDLLLSFDCVQHDREPTPVSGGTLDLVITRIDQTVDDVIVDPPHIISDHGLVTWNIPFKNQSSILEQRTTRNWRKLDHTIFRQAFLESALNNA